MTSPESPEIRNTISLIAVAVCVQYGLHDTQEELNSSFWHLHTDSKESSSGNVWQVGIHFLALMQLAKYTSFPNTNLTLLLQLF